MSSRPLALGSKQTRLLLASVLYQRQHGRAPTWTELAVATKLDRPILISLMLGLRKRGLVEFTEEPRSLAVTEQGLRAALIASRKPKAA